jgi:hypothetical protein
MSDDRETPREGKERDPDGAQRVEGPRPDQEIFEAFPNVPAAFAMDPADGMARPQIETAQSYAPALDTATLICMEDASSFVHRGQWGEVVESYDREKVVRAPDGRWRVLAQRGPRWLPRWLCRIFWGAPVWLEVEALRPKCQYYARQMTDFQDDPERKFVARLCTARRTDEGEFLSVRDAQIYACELRRPRALDGVEQLDAFDAKKIELGRERTREQLAFDVDAALAKKSNGDGDDPWSGSGIFSER